MRESLFYRIFGIILFIFNKKRDSDSVARISESAVLQLALSVTDNCVSFQDFSSHSSIAPDYQFRSWQDFVPVAGSVAVRPLLYNISRKLLTDSTPCRLGDTN